MPESEEMPSASASSPSVAAARPDGGAFKEILPDRRGVAMIAAGVLDVLRLFGAGVFPCGPSAPSMWNLFSVGRF